MSKTNEKFKKLSFFLCFILIFDFLVLNFGIKPKEVKATTTNINSLRVLDFEYSKHEKFMYFDFGRSLLEGETITGTEIKENKSGAKVFEGEAVSGSKTKFLFKNAFIDDREYIGKVTIRDQGNKTYSMSFNFNFQAPETQLKPSITVENGKNIKINLNTYKNNLGNSIGMKDDENVNIQILKENRATIHENLTVEKTAQQVNETNGIILMNNAMQHLQVNTPYLLRVNTAYRDYIIRFFVTGTDSSKKINFMRVLVQDSVRNNDGTINLSIKLDGVSPTRSDQVKIKDESGQFKTGTLSNNVFKFDNLDVRTDRKYPVRFEKGTNDISECYYTNAGFGAFMPLNGIFSSETPDVVNFNIEKMFPFFAKDNSKNKFVVYELNDDGVTNKKELGSKTGVGIRGNQTINLNGSLAAGKVYKMEFQNGTKTYYRTVRYEAFEVSALNVEHTSATINWDYPKNYTPQSGDRVEIFLKQRRDASYPATPKELIVQGSGGINLENVKSKKITGISPNTNYDAKVVLYNQRGAITSITGFTTKSFVLTKPIEIKDAVYENNKFKNAFIRSRTMTVEWETNPSNIEFNPGDKVEIFVKPNGTSEFSGYPNNDKYRNPVFSAIPNNVKSANITIPSWMTKFHVDLIYTIGGNKILTESKDGYGEAKLNRRTAEAKVNKPTLEVSDITQTSAKLKWSYDRDSLSKIPYKPENGHRVLINLKKVNSANDNTVEGFDAGNKKLEVIQGANDGDLLSTTEYALTGLEVGQHYRARIRHILEDGSFDGNWRFLDDFCNFQTGSFSIENLKAEQISQSPKVKLTWGTSGEPQFGDGEDEQKNINIYLKEGNTSEYPLEPLSDITIQDYSQEKGKNKESESNQQSQPTKQCEIELPKYNTRYNVKVEYVVRGKKIEEIVMAQADGDIKVSIGDINNTSATIKWEYPNGYEELKDSRKNDKIIVKVNEKSSSESREGSNLNEFESGKEIDVNSNNVKINSLTGDKDYDIVVKFMNDSSEVSKVNTTFKATSSFQVVALVASDVSTNSAKLSWDYAGSHTFQKSQDKLDIFIKDITQGQSKQKREADDDIRTNYKKIIRYTHQDSGRAIEEDSILFKSGDGGNHSKIHNENVDLNNMKSTNLKNLEMNKEYSIQLQYMKGEGSNTKNGNSSEVRFKTMNPKFDATVFTSNQTTATFGWEYPKGYQLQENDKVEIFIKELKDNGNEDATPQPDGLGYETPLLTLTNGSEDPEEGKYNLNEVTRVDVSGLTPEKKYKAKVKFTMNGGTQPSIETEANISTKSFSIKSFTVDSYQEYDILAKWEIEPENMMFSPADKLEIFVKVVKDGEEELKDTIDKKPQGYPNEPAYKLTMDPNDHIENKTISDTFSDYVLAESLGVKQRMLLVYTVGGKEYYKELEFINTINPVKAEVTSVDQTRALIGITAPDNYEFVTGDKLLVYAKDEFAGDAPIESDDFLVFEGVQSETLSIPDDMRMIELSYLLPEAKYEVLVALDLEDGTVEPAKLEFTTTALPVSDIKLESLKHDSAVISWDYGEKEIDFFKDEGSYDFTDKLIIVHKEADGTAIPDDIEAIKKFPHVEYLGEDIKSVKDADIKVEDPSKDYDVAVCYDLGGLLYKKNFKTSYLSVKTDEESVTDNGIKINWKYPSNITFGDGDKTEVFIRKKDEANYPEAPSTSSTGSGTVSYTFDNLEGETSYVAKVQITKEGLQIDPVEVEFQTKLGLAEETVIEDIQQEIVGTEAQVTIPGLENLEVKEEKLEVSMGNEEYKDFKVRLTDDGTGVIIEPTIPKKVYKNIEVTIPLEDGSVRKIIIAEFVTQPADVGQDWLSNAYKFAFDRFPDEGGYSYWYNERIKKKTMSGEYFLMNLLFGEDEFTNRNLGDKDLIAALYQIVVNRDYDEEGLNFWVGIYNENLGNAQGNKKLAQEVLVDRMVHEAEFGKLCENIGIFWTKAQQEAAGVPM